MTLTGRVASGAQQLFDVLDREHLAAAFYFTVHRQRRVVMTPASIMAFMSVTFSISYSNPAIGRRLRRVGRAPRISNNLCRALAT